MEFSGFWVFLEYFGGNLAVFGVGIIQFLVVFGYFGVFLYFRGTWVWYNMVFDGFLDCLGVCARFRIGFCVFCETWWVLGDLCEICGNLVFSVFLGVLCVIGVFLYFRCLGLV